MAIDAVADMVAVGHGFVSAVRAMDMVVFVAVAVMAVGAAGRVFLAHVQLMLIIMILMGW